MHPPPMAGTARRARRWASCRTRCWASCRAFLWSCLGTSLVVPAAIWPHTRGWRRIAMSDNRTRRRRHRAPRVNDDVFHDERLFRRFDSRAVAMSADGRAISMGDHPRAVANRTKRTVNVIAVHPSSCSRASHQKRRRRHCQNLFNVLVHVTPRFLAVRKKSGRQIDKN